MPAVLLGLQPRDDAAGVVADLESLAGTDPGPAVEDLAGLGADLDGDLDATQADVFEQRRELVVREIGQEVVGHEDGTPGT